MKRPTSVAAPGPSSVHCVVDSFDEGHITGWAFDPNAGHQPARFFVLVDGEQTNEVICQGLRPDVASAGLAPETVGFRAMLPRRLLDGESHHVEFRDSRRQAMTLRVNDQEAASFDFTAKWQPKVRSYVDGLRAGGFEGWVLRTCYETGQFEGDCMVRVTCEGLTIGHTRANQVRADVGRSPERAGALRFSVRAAAIGQARAQAGLPVLSDAG